MTKEAKSKGLSLYQAAREVGVSFSREWEPKSKFVKANDMKFHYLEWGDTSNPVIVMLHGFAQQAHSWDFVALAFADRYRVIAIDQRGHGDSAWAKDGDYTPETQQIEKQGIVEEIKLEHLV